MKTLLLTLTYLVGIGELILAGYFWKTHSGSEIRKVMGMLSMVTGLWVLAKHQFSKDRYIFLPLIIKSHFGYIGSLFTSVWMLLTGYVLVRR